MSPPKDEEREERIIMDIVVDAYDPEERSMGWYYYLADTIQFPFTAKCKSRRQISPVKMGDTVNVIGIGPMAPTMSKMGHKLESFDAYDFQTLDF